MVYFERIVIAAFILIALFLGVDIFDDLSHGSDLTHVLLEGIALLLSSTILVIYVLSFSREMTQRFQHSTRTLKEVTEDRDRWRSQSEQYLKGLGVEIEKQFSLWNLSSAEKEVGILILKGLAHKEIAALRNSSERTVRQQAAALYAKAGLDNKAQLSAFFLEDLMLPKL